MVGEILLTAVVLLLSVYALADIISRFSFRFLFSSKKRQEYYVLSLGGSAEDAEYAVRRMALLRWFFPFKNVLFVVLDRGMSAESEAVAAKLCRELELPFLTEKEWADTLQSPPNEV